MPNLELEKLALSNWRKLALGSWSAAGDPSVYGALEIDVSLLLKRQSEFKTRGESLTLTTIFAKAIAMTLHKHPQINGLIRFRQLYRRKTVTLFLQTAVDDEGKELSGVTIDHAEKKSIQQIAAELAKKAKDIREDRDLNFKKAKSTFAVVPPFMMRLVLNFIGFLLYTLNLDLRWAGLPRDPFGSVMITSIGSLGLEEAYAPLVHYSRVPLLLALGAVRQKPIVKNDQVIIAPIVKICVTLDHRLIDGVYAAKMAKTMRWLLETDQGLNELGLA